MTERRSRTRGATPPADTANKPKLGSRGRGGYEIAKEERERAQARRDAAGSNHFRFYQKAGDEARFVVVLDDKLDDIFFMHEHSLWNGKGSDDIPCVKDHGQCVLCDAADTADKDSVFKPSYYAAYLTIIDQTPYKIQSGDRQGQTIPHTRKVLPIKSAQIDEFWRVLQAAEKQNGTIRGTELQLLRTTKQEAKHGHLVCMESGMMFETLTEAELEEFFGHDAVSKDGKVIKEENADLEAYDFMDMFEAPDQAKLAKAYNLPEPEDTIDAHRAEMDDEQRDSGEGAQASTGDAPPPRSRGARARSRGGDSAEAPADTGGTRTRARRTRREPAAQEGSSGDDSPFQGG